MICAMRDLTFRVFEHLEITPKMDVDKRIKCTERILRLLSLKEYIHIMEDLKEYAKGVAGDQWNLGVTNNVTMEQFLSRAKVGAIDILGDLFTIPERCKVVVRVGKDHVEETSEHLPGPCVIHPQ